MLSRCFLFPQKRFIRTKLRIRVYKNSLGYSHTYRIRDCHNSLQHFVAKYFLEIKSYRLSCFLALMLNTMFPIPVTRTLTIYVHWCGRGKWNVSNNFVAYNICWKQNENKKIAGLKETSNTDILGSLHIFCNG